MKSVCRWLVIASLALPIVVANSVLVAEEPAGSAVKNLTDNPDDAKAMNAWLTETLKAISEVMDSAPDKAEKKIAEAKTLLDSLKPESAAGKALHARAKLTINSYDESLALRRVSLADLEKGVDAKPDDLKLLSRYRSKLSMEIGGIARAEPVKADQLLNTAKERVAKLKEAATDEAAKTQLEALEKMFPALATTIKHGHELAALIGKKAPSLEFDDWANGAPLTNSELKGKVVLLDFWAIWCGPCIATFPHLREWQETYSDKGLVIIGMTQYYGYEWNDAANRPMRPVKKPVEKKEGEDKDKEAEKEPVVTHESEQAMLKKFAEFHKLQHPFAIQTKEHSIAAELAVRGIPQVVVIDRQGVIRLIRVGSGPANAKAIHDMIEKLLADKPVAAK